MVLFAAGVCAQRPVPRPKERPAPPPGVRFEEPSQASEPAEPPGTIGGRTVNLVTGEPLRKVTLSLRKTEGPGASYSATSDAEGRFAFSKVAPGRYRLQGERVGFTDQSYSMSSRSQRATLLWVQSGQAVKDILFKLTPQAVITGRVVDEDGDPLPGAAVQVLRYSYAGGSRHLMAVAANMTNDIGEYRIANLHPGRYYVSASGRRREFLFTGVNPPAAGEPRREGYTTTFYPGAGDPTGAAPLELSAGAEMRGIDLRLLKRSVFRIRGKVEVAATGLSTGNLMVAVMPRSRSLAGGFSRTVARVNQRDGTFQVEGVMPGSYVLTVNQTVGRQQGVTRQAVEVGEADVEGLVVTLQPPTELSGSVRVEGDPAVPLDLQRTTITLMPMDDLFNPAVGRPEEDGSFTLAGVLPDRYRVGVQGLAEGFYVKSARFADQEVLSTGLDLTSGAAASPLEIVLGQSSGSIEGVVLNEKGEPAGGVAVTLIPEESQRQRSELHRSATADQAGNFSLRGVAPGDYTLYAWEDVEQGAWLDPEFLKKYSGQAKPVTVRDSGREALQLKQIPVEPARQP